MPELSGDTQLEMKVGAGQTPSWLPRWQRPLWRHPWWAAARHAFPFHKRLWNHGYLSPHFHRSEFASKGDNCGCSPAPVPESARHHAQLHAFRLEIARHRLGRSLSPISAGRTPCHNSCVGGASLSQHLEWRATDWAAQPEQARFDHVMREVFRDGGIGSCASGRVAHVDTRGFAARWTYTSC